MPRTPMPRDAPRGDGEYDANPVFDAAGAAGWIRGWGTTTRARIGCGASS